MTEATREAQDALRYLAENDRPQGGQSKFNAEHLLQIADALQQAEAGEPVAWLQSQNGVQIVSKHRLDAAAFDFDWTERPLYLAPPASAHMREALAPFAACVFNDNGDVTIDRSHLRIEHYMRAKTALSREGPKSEGGVPFGGYGSPEAAVDAADANARSCKGFATALERIRDGEQPAPAIALEALRMPWDQSGMLSDPTPPDRKTALTEAQLCEILYERTTDLTGDQAKRAAKVVYKALTGDTGILALTSGGR